MPLDITGSYASSSSTGAIARNTARNTNAIIPPASLGFAGLSARGGTTGIEEIEVSSSGSAAVYVSPFIRLDIKTRLAIVEIRNSQTGEVQQQYPSPRVVREYAQNLPDDSDLRITTSSENGSQANDPAFTPRIIGSADDKAAEAAETPVVTFGQGSNSSGQAPAPAQAPIPSGLARAASAAFSSLQNTLVGGRELAVA